MTRARVKVYNLSSGARIRLIESSSRLTRPSRRTAERLQSPEGDQQPSTGSAQRKLSPRSAAVGRGSPCPETVVPGAAGRRGFDR